ncbi:hypothetical protein BCR33DRAFT_644715, partial [Rhizoclosmatium globosum]
LSKHAAERNELERAQFLQFISQFPREYLVFFDEAAWNEKSLQRRFGYSPTGRRAVISAPFVRGVRFSIIAAICVSHGFLDFAVEEGPLNGNDVYTFISEVLV